MKTATLLLLPVAFTAGLGSGIFSTRHNSTDTTAQYVLNQQQAEIQNSEALSNKSAGYAISCPFTDCLQASKYEDRIAEIISSAVQTVVTDQLICNEKLFAAQQTGPVTEVESVVSIEFEQQMFDTMMVKLNDPVINQSLNFHTIGSLPEMQGMGAEARNTVLSEIAEKLTRGELDPETFLQSPN